MRISKTKIYTYDPVMIDIIDPPYDIKKGDQVKVTHVPGCPAPGTMGMCHVKHVETGRFAGLVSVNSLI